MSAYHHISEVEPPSYRPYQAVIAMSNGKWRNAEVQSVKMCSFKEGRRTMWRWEYWIEFCDTRTGVRRTEEEIRL